MKYFSFKGKFFQFKVHVFSSFLVQDFDMLFKISVFRWIVSVIHLERSLSGYRGYTTLFFYIQLVPLLLHSLEKELSEEYIAVNGLFHLVFIQGRTNFFRSKNTPPPLQKWENFPKPSGKFSQTLWKITSCTRQKPGTSGKYWQMMLAKYMDPHLYMV